MKETADGNKPEFSINKEAEILAQGNQYLNVVPESSYWELLKSSGEELFGGSILEAGRSTSGLARHLENLGVEAGYQTIKPVIERVDIAAGVATNLPYPDGAFDFVVCNDVLGHLPASERPRMIAEFIRVAGRKCFFLGPHGSIAMGLETRLAELLGQSGLARPSSLEAHLENGLPRLGDTFGAVCSAGFVPVVRRNEGIVEHYLPILTGLPIPASGMTGVFARIKGATAGNRNGEKEMPYSVLITVDKHRHLSPVADPFAGLSRREAGNAAPGVDESAGLTLYSTHHKPSPLVEKFRLIRPLDVSGQMPGTALAMKDPQGFFEERNDRCSELSAFHYVWRKKLYGDIVGFCHYRRFLLPFPEAFSEAEVRVGAGQMEALLPRIEDAHQLVSLLEGCDLLTARPSSLEFLLQDEQYGMAHYAKDYYAMLECAIDRHPWLGPALAESMNSGSLYAANMMVCRKELFEVFCSVWFDVLACCAERLDPADRDAYQRRDIAFLSERLFDTLVRHLQRTGFKVCELPKIFVGD